MTVGALDWARGLLRRIGGAKEDETMTTTGGGHHSSDLVEVYRAAHNLEAQVIKGLLESNDIPVLLVGESLGTTLAVSIGALAEVRVMVPEPLADRALELLSAPDEVSGSDASTAEAVQGPDDA